MVSTRSNTKPSNSRLLSLPVELFVRITDLLSFADRQTLSRVNAQCRSLLAPSVFRDVKVRNIEKDTQDLEHFLAEFGRHVERLHFECHLAPNTEDEHANDDEEDKDRPWFTEENTAEKEAAIDALRIQRALFPASLQDVLRGVALPGLKTLKISFEPEDNYDAEGWDNEEFISSHFDEESEEDVFQAEREFAWRAVLVQMWGLLAQRTSIRDLEIDNLPPRSCSALWTDEWAAFCSRIENFSLSVWGGDNGAGWHSNTTESYTGHLAALERSFFAHLSSATQVTLHANPDNPIGLTGRNHCPLPFPRDAMPHLGTLHLSSCFIDPALLSFLTAHAKSLRTLHLIDCLAGGTAEQPLGMAEDALSWAQFLSRYAASDPLLTGFSIQNSEAPLTSHEKFPRHRPAVEDTEDVAAVRTALRTDPARRVFAYVALDDKYGMVFHDEGMNVERFLDGADQRAYDALMARVVETRVANGLEG